MSLELLIAAAKGDFENVKRLIEIEQVDINFVAQLDNRLLDTDDNYPETKTWCNAVTAALITNVFLIGSAMRKKTNKTRGERSNILRYLINKGAKIEVNVPEETKSRNTYSTTLALAFRKDMDIDIFKNILELSEDLNPLIYPFLEKPRSMINYFFSCDLINYNVMLQRFALVFQEAIFRGDKNTLCELISRDIANTKNVSNPNEYFKAYIENKILNPEQVKDVCLVLDKVVMETERQPKRLTREIALEMKFIMARKIVNQSGDIVVILDEHFLQNIKLRNYNNKLSITIKELFWCIDNSKRIQKDLRKWVNKNISDATQLMDTSREVISVTKPSIIHDCFTYDLLIMMLKALKEEKLILATDLQKKQKNIRKIEHKISQSIEKDIMKNISQLINSQNQLMQLNKTCLLNLRILKNDVIQQFKKQNLLLDYPQLTFAIDPIFNFFGNLLIKIKQENDHIVELGTQKAMKGADKFEKALEWLPDFTTGWAKDANQLEKNILNFASNFIDVIGEKIELSEDCLAVDTTILVIRTKVKAFLNAPELDAIRRFYAEIKRKILIVEAELNHEVIHPDKDPAFKALMENVHQLNQELLAELFKNDKLIDSLLKKYADLFLAESFCNRLNEISSDLFQIQRTQCRADKFMKEINPIHYKKFRKNLGVHISEPLSIERNRTATENLPILTLAVEGSSASRPDLMNSTNWDSLHLNAHCQMVLTNLFKQGYILKELIKEQKLLINSIKNNKFTSQISSEKIDDLILQIKPLIKRLKKEAIFIVSKLEYYKDTYDTIFSEKEVKAKDLEAENRKELHLHLERLVGKGNISSIALIDAQNFVYSVMFPKPNFNIMVACLKKLTALEISAEIKHFEKGTLSPFWDITYLAITGPLDTVLEKFNTIQSDEIFKKILA